MNLQRLEGFYWVARTGGYARASRAFPYPITAPGVHQQVKRLEADLGVKLFERVGRDTLVRTAAGAQLYELVAPFLDKLPAALQQIAGGELHGRVRVRAPALLLRSVMPAWLARLEKAHPGVLVELDDIGSGDVSAVQRGEADVYVDHLPVVPPELDTRPVTSTRPFVVVPARHRLARSRAAPMRALQGEPFVAYGSDHRQRELQLTALGLHGLEPSRITGASSADAILALVAAGLGFSIVPALRGGPAHPGVAAWPLPPPTTEFPVVAAWRRTAADHPLVAAFLAAAPREPGRGSSTARG